MVWLSHLLYLKFYIFFFRCHKYFALQRHLLTIFRTFLFLLCSIKLHDISSKCVIFFFTFLTTLFRESLNFQILTDFWVTKYTVYLTTWKYKGWNIRIIAHLHRRNKFVNIYLSKFYILEYTNSKFVMKVYK